MNREQLAEKLNGSNYLLRSQKEWMQKAKDNGLVIVYGASDDLIEFDGAIYDEAGASDRGEIQIDKLGVLPSFEQIKEDGDMNDLKKWFAREEKAKVITCHWAEDGYSWTYSTDIPHATFDIIDEGETYCRGMVIDINDLT
jgi:hypothetical protein